MNLGFAVLWVALAAAAPDSRDPAPTYCAEWIRQSTHGYERLTLFADRTVVWKTSRDGNEEIQRQRLDPSEFSFYCAYFRRREIWDLKEDLRTGLTSELAGQSAVTITRPGGSVKRIRFDDLSPLPADASALRSALEGLRLSMLAPLAPASRFTADKLAAGTLLKRFDGMLFRVKQLFAEKGLVELEGVAEPYSEFQKIGELRFQFSPPD